MFEKLSPEAESGLSYCFLAAYDEIKDNIKSIRKIPDSYFIKKQLSIVLSHTEAVKIAVKELGFDIMYDNFNALSEECKSTISKLN